MARYGVFVMMVEAWREREKPSNHDRRGSTRKGVSEGKCVLVKEEIKIRF